MMQSRIGVSVLVLIIASAGPMVRADGPNGSSVTGQGSHELKKQPESLRVQVDILAKGKSVKEALTKLRERKQAAQHHLDTLGATAHAVEFGEPSIVLEKTERDRAEMIFMRQMRMGGKKPAQKPKEPPPVVVSCTLVAELPLKASNAEEMLILTHGLEERIRTADLGGLKDMKQASPQDEELAQEAGDLPENEGPKRGEPMFFYVCKISREAEVKAMAEAFQRAKQHAGQLARASGMELGALQRIDDGSVASAPDMEESMLMQGPYGYRIQQLMDRSRGSVTSADKPTAEAVGLQPTKVLFRVGVSASFELVKRPTLKSGTP